MRRSDVYPEPVSYQPPRTQPGGLIAGPSGTAGRDGTDGKDGTPGRDGAPGPEGPRGPKGDIASATIDGGNF